MSRIHFVTGTDTGAGKTVLAGCLLYFFRRSGLHALAMKPFATGQRRDVRILQRIQQGELKEEDCCPYHFAEPVAPWLAAQRTARHIPLRHVLKRIRQVQAQCDVLVVEGIGGLLVPLGRKYTVRELISELDCEVWIAAHNRLGTINHCLLTLAALGPAKPQRVRLVLMEPGRPDNSSSSNEAVLREWTGLNDVRTMPHLGAHPVGLESLKKHWKKIKKVLAPMFDSGNFCAPSIEGADKKAARKRLTD